jgi:hypothetical protein
MMRKPFVALAVSAVLTVAVFAAAGSSSVKSSSVTVGDFAAQVAVALGYEVPNQKAAVDALRNRGVNLTVDLNTQLTDGQVARMMSDLGIQVAAPTNPASPVSQASASIFASTIGSTDSLAAPSTESTVPPPTQCLSSADRGTCVNCCKDSTGLTGKYCGHFCHANVPPPPSPTEPTP